VGALGDRPGAVPTRAVGTHCCMRESPLITRSSICPCLPPPPPPPNPTQPPAASRCCRAASGRRTTGSSAPLPTPRRSAAAALSPPPTRPPCAPSSAETSPAPPATPAPSRTTCSRCGCTRRATAPSYARTGRRARGTCASLRTPPTSSAACQHRRPSHPPQPRRPPSRPPRQQASRAARGLPPALPAQAVAWWGAATAALATCPRGWRCCSLLRWGVLRALRCLHLRLPLLCWHLLLYSSKDTLLVFTPARCHQR